MKRYLVGGVIVVLLGIISLTSFLWEEEGIRELDLTGLESIYKNKITNISDRYAIAGNRIYFVKDTLNGELFSMDLTGKEIAKVSDDNIMDFKISDDWIYYSNTEGLFKRKIDGSMQTKLAEGFIPRIQIIGNEIFYNVIKTKDLFNFESYKELYKVDIDGRLNVKVCEDMPTDFTVIDDSIYFTLSSNPYTSLFLQIDVGENSEENTDKYKLYKMSLDGTDKLFITDIDNPYINNYCNTILYSKNNGLYSVHTNDIANEIKLIEFNPFDIFIDEDSIYYITGMDSIYELNIKSGEKKRLIKSSVDIIGFDVIGDWIFYECSNKTLFGRYSDTVRVIRKDGSQKQLFMKY